MTTTTARCKRRAGFSLVEVMMVVTISSLVLAGAMSAFVLIGRSSVATSDYSQFDEEARKGLEKFARDVRMSKAVVALSTTSVTLRVLDDEAASHDVTYAYVAAENSFYRAPGTPDAEILIRDIDRFELTGYKVTREPTVRIVEAKQLQLQLRSIRSGGARALASNNVVSARYILRNMPISK